MSMNISSNSVPVSSEFQPNTRYIKSPHTNIYLVMFFYVNISVALLNVHMYLHISKKANCIHIHSILTFRREIQFLIGTPNKGNI